MITQNDLINRFSYNTETGHFIWKENARPNVAGKRAGRLLHDGYWQIKLYKKGYQAHRLIWLFHYGFMPNNEIDHINGVRSDNRIENLRLATRSENCQNLHRANIDNQTKELGVTFHKKANKFQAQICINGKHKYLGLYKTAKSAHEAYLLAKHELHPFSQL